MAHAYYLWGILISAFILDCMRRGYVNSKNQDQAAESSADTQIETPKFEGIKVTEGNTDLNVKYDSPINNDSKQFINIKIQYW
jgi:hypothetical protein